MEPSTVTPAQRGGVMIGGTPTKEIPFATALGDLEYTIGSTNDLALSLIDRLSGFLAVPVEPNKPTETIPGHGSSPVLNKVAELTERLRKANGSLKFILQGLEI